MMNNTLQGILFLLVMELPAIARGAIPDAMQSPGKITDITSFWAMARLGGGIGYVIMGVLAVGIFLIIYKLIELVLDKRHSATLLRISFQDKSITDIEDLVRGNGGSLLKNAIIHLIDFFRAGGNARDMHQELIEFLDSEHDKFETYRNWLSFLSDSAGALGLLGTAWGVFLTFFGGNLDSEKILNGMGVALITTLLGLVVSLIINFFSTQLYSAYQNRLSLVSKKGDEFRLHLFRMANSSNPKEISNHTPYSPGIPTSATLSPPNVPAPQGSAKNNGMPQLQVLQIKTREIPVRSVIRSAIQLKVLEGTGNPVEKATLILKTEGPLMLSSDGTTRTKIFSDENGEATIDLISGAEIGAARLHCMIAGFEDEKKTIPFLILPGEAEKLLVVSGNDQAGLVGSELPESFNVKVTDQFGNPVANAPVQFRLTNGSGILDGSNHHVVKKSDANGIARARLVLGKQPGFHTVVASLNGNKNTSVVFRVLCKA